ncbi:hypothetical protein HYS00_00460, partial [Candidatus Microgenomates bacterium]|nr:hypothetical protein [Candidatus Microgenomates bacterium]
PSYTGDRYGNPGDGVLLASANGARICATAPAPTATPTSAPTVISAPTGVTVVEGDANGGATIQTRSVKVTWAFPDAGAGCGSAWANTCPSSTTKFYIKFTGPSSVPQGQIASTGTRAYTSGASLTTNGTYTVNVCANNGTQEKCTAASFTKVPYPTGVLSGQLYERTPSVTPIACYAGARALYAGSITLVPNTNGYSTTCTVTPSSGAALTYSCIAQLDNQNYDPNPNQSFTVQYQGNNLYSSVSCGITCGGPSPTPTITPSPTPTNTPTPTPTRTPTPTPTRTPTPSPTPVITTSNIDDNTLGAGQNQFEYVANWTPGTDASA